MAAVLCEYGVPSAVSKSGPGQHLSQCCLETPTFASHSIPATEIPRRITTVMEPIIRMSLVGSTIIESLSWGEGITQMIRDSSLHSVFFFILFNMKKGYCTQMPGGGAYRILRK